MMVQEEASEEQHQIGGKTFVNSTSVEERTPTMTAPPTCTHNIPILVSLYEFCRFVNTMNLFERIEEATLVLTIAGSTA